MSTQPSPPWGRGWRASGVVISRGPPGEGVRAVNTPHAYHRATHSLAHSRSMERPPRFVLRQQKGQQLSGTLVIRGRSRSFKKWGVGWLLREALG